MAIWAAPSLPWFAGADSWFQAGALAGGRAAGLVTKHTWGRGHFLILLIFTLALLEVRTILPPILAIP